MKKFSMILVALAGIVMLNATTALGATRTASATGNWNSTATWGGSSVPTSADDVIINSNVTVTVTAAAACNTINFTTGTSGAALLTISGSNSLSVTGAVTIQRQNSGGSTNTVAVNAGSMSCASVALQSTSSRNSVITISTGTLTVSGNITSGGTASQIVFSGAGTLNVGGTFMSGAQGTFTASTGTVKFNAGGAQSIAPYAYTYNNVILSGSGPKTTTNAIINGTLSMEGTATTTGTVATYGAAATLQYKGIGAQTTGTEFPAAWNGSGGVIIANTSGNAVTLGGAKTINALLTINSSATLSTSAANSYALTFGGNFDNSGTFVGNSSTITISGTGTQSIGGFTTTGTVSMTKTAGTATFTGAMSAGPLSLSTAGGTLNLGTSLTHGCTNLTVSAGTLNGGSSTLNVSGNVTTGGTFTASTSTINYNGAAQTCGVWTYNNLTLSNSGVKTFATTPTVNGVLSMEGTATVTVTTGSVSYGASATLQYNATAGRTASSEEWITPFAATGGVIIANTGTVTLNAAKVLNASVPLTVRSGATLNTSAANNYQLTFGGNFVNNGGTLNANASPIVITNTMPTQSIAGFTTTGLVSMTKTGGTATFTGNVNGGALTINGIGGTLDLGPGLTHTFTGTVTQTAGTLNLGSSALNIAGTMSVTGGAFTAGTGTVNYNGSSSQTIPALDYYNLTSSSSGARTLASSGTIGIAGTFTRGANAYTITGSTVNFNGSGAQSVPAMTYNNLILSASGAKSFSAATTINGNLTISGTASANLGTYTSSSNSLTLGGEGQRSGSWGGTGSGATNINTTCFPAASGILNVATSTAPSIALQFNGSNQYVTFGQATSTLGVTIFTLEAWVYRNATGGVAVSTGSLGFDGADGRPNGAYPVLTKGSAQVDSPPNYNMNWFLGITSTGFIGADFEDNAGGVNHPVWGLTTVTTGAWHHIAATYDGQTWRLYLDGNLDKTLTLASPFTPEATSIQHAGVATCLTTEPAPNGYFAGTIDEARVWNFARSISEIQSTINSQIATAQAGLLGRWGLNDGTGLTAANSVSGSPAGTLTNTPTWVTPGAPFNITITPPTPPNAPSNLEVMTPVTNSILELRWTDNSTNETGFEIERSTTGSGGPFTPHATVAAGVVRYYSTGLNPLKEYCYRVRATNGSVQSDYTTPACATTLADASNALAFAGANAYVTFGNPALLKLTQFTIETWFRRDGVGVPTTTGASGIPNAVPLVAKGTADAEVPAQDINYLLGINNDGNYLCADFEEYPGGLNHPITGVTPIVQGTWYHAAVTYDGTKWQLFLNGILEAELVVGAQPGNASDCPVSLATSIKRDPTPAGTPLGFFDGVMDEVRIWNYARSGAEIITTINSQIIAAQSGLIARWGLNEGTGTAVNGSGGTTINGTVTGAGYSWAPGAPFNILFTSPNAPSNLVVTPISNSALELRWTDNATNESGFEIERSTSGPVGPFTPLGTVTANVVTYNSTGLDPVTNYCYRVRAASGLLKSAYTTPACGTTLTTANNALDFAGTNAYVTFGNPASLKLTQFTIETWFRRDGVGVSTTTGTSGIPNAVPLVSKGTADTEVPERDINYLLGINNDGNLLCADFEEYPGSLNHPITGVTPIVQGIWYHAAVTYNGTKWQLFLNGTLEAELVVGAQPGNASDCPVSLATSIKRDPATLIETPLGFFDGVMDEVRIWNYARTLTEIRSTINSQITTAQTGLLARWDLNEGTGTAVNGSAGTTINGTVTGANYSWAPGAPFNLLNFPPNVPTLNAPANGATSVSTPSTLDVTVSDPDGGNLTVNFYGQPAISTAVTFSVIVLPDAQNYTSSSGGSPATFTAQTQWCVDNKTPRNIQYVSQVGDITNDNTTTAWGNANTSMSLLDATPPGIPYGIILGNHDYSGSTTLYGNYFPASRFEGRPYYGGHYGSNNENHYEFFNSDGLEFIVINLSSSDQNPATAVLDWADNLLKTYGTKRGILVNHSLVNAGNPATFTGPGQIIYDALKDNPNLFLMLGGHVPGEGRRQDTYNGNTIYSLLADYQNEANGGNGWLRIMEFDPPNNQIHVTTYSPTLNQWKTTSSSQFDLPYSMQPNRFQLIGTNSGVASGSSTTKAWPGLSPLTKYEWYVTASDGIATTTSSTWSFTTAAAPTNYVVVNARVCLQGPFAGGTMSTVLRTVPGFPLTQPYNTAPWNYTTGTESVGAIPADVVDWALVELRTGTPPTMTTVKRRAAFLKSDGTIVDIDGSSQVSFPAVSPGSYYIVICHRNHLAVMSSGGVSLGATSSTLYDFTTGQAKAYTTGPSSMKDLGGGKFGMYAGDANGDGSPTIADRVLWRLENGGPSGYFSADFNLSGDVTIADRVLWRLNNGWSTQVP